MTSDSSPQPISPLRARMIEDMSVRGFKERHAARLCPPRARLRGLHRPVA